MSTKSDQIDLNSDGATVDRRKMGYLPVKDVSVCETLIDSNLLGVGVRVSELTNGNSQGVVGRVVSENLDGGVMDKEGTRVCDLSVGGNGVDMSSGDVVGEVMVEEKKIGGLDNGERVCDLSVGGNGVKMSSEEDGDEVIVEEKQSEGLDNGDDVNKGESVGILRDESVDEIGVVDEGVSGEVKRDGEVNMGLVKEEVEKDANVMVHSSFDGDRGDLMPQDSGQVVEEDPGDAKMGGDMNACPFKEDLEPTGNVTMNLSPSDGNISQSLPEGIVRETERAVNGEEMDRKMDAGVVQEVLEEETTDDVRKQAKELGAEVEASGNELVNVSEARSDSHAVDLPSVTAVGQVSGNIDTKLVSSKSKFCVADLVWGKVRSHPWWPGQICDPSDAVQKALKYSKKDTYMVAYFGDETFAWNEVSKIKHFREYFAQMEKQSNLEEFHYAVDSALEEVSRRTMYGLSCSCIPDEVFEKIKTQRIVNAGIKEESSLREGGDRFSNAASFDPIKLHSNIKTLAQSPLYGEIDRLELVTEKAQLSAFYSWKGHPWMAEFNILGGLLDSDAEIPLPVVAEQSTEVAKSSIPHSEHIKQVTLEKAKLKSQDGSSHKRKHSSGDGVGKKEKEMTLSDLLAERQKKMSKAKGNKLISPSSGKKRQVATSTPKDSALKHKQLDSDSDDTAVRHKKLDSISDVIATRKSGMVAAGHERRNLSAVVASKYLPIKKTFGIGNSILKVASQLNGPNLLLKCTEKNAYNNKIEEISSTGKEPATKSSSEEQSQDETFGDRAGETLMKSGKSELDQNDDCSLTNQVMENTFEEQQSFGVKRKAVEVSSESPSEKDSPTNLESEPQPDGGSPKLGEEHSADSNDGSERTDPFPTALILNFTDVDSVPSKEELNDIFRRFGSLNENQTSPGNGKRAKVVFRRRVDAEAAFSSAGKYRIFGPSLVSYCLKYMYTSSKKASPKATRKRGRKAARTED